MCLNVNVRALIRPFMTMSTGLSHSVGSSVSVSVFRFELEVDDVSLSQLSFSNQSLFQDATGRDGITKLDLFWQRRAPHESIDHTDGLLP